MLRLGFVVSRLAWSAAKQATSLRRALPVTVMLAGLWSSSAAADAICGDGAELNDSPAYVGRCLLRVDGRVIVDDRRCEIRINPTGRHFNLWNKAYYAHVGRFASDPFEATWNAGNGRNSDFPLGMVRVAKVRPHSYCFRGRRVVFCVGDNTPPAACEKID